MCGRFVLAQNAPVVLTAHTGKYTRERLAQTVSLAVSLALSARLPFVSLCLLSALSFCTRPVGSLCTRQCRAMSARVRGHWPFRNIPVQASRHLERSGTVSVLERILCFTHVEEFR